MHISKDYRKEIYRKSIHFSSFWMPAFIYFAPKTYAIALFAIILLGDIILEYGNYKKWIWAKKIFMIFALTLRNKESQHTKFKVTGSVYMLLAALLCSILFSKPVAVIAMSVMLISDSMAALIGKAIGKHKIYKNKSLEGTAAFFISAMLIMLIFIPLHPFAINSIFACIMATLAELFESSVKIDDNLSIPLIIGLTLTLL